MHTADTDLVNLMRCFCALVEQGNFTKTAQQLNYTTSKISKDISKLEKQLNCRLIIRTTRSITITENGHHFYQQSKKILEQVDGLKRDLLKAHNFPAGVLTVTASPAVGQFLLTPLLSQFTALYPDIQLDLIWTNETLDLVSRNIDVAIRSQPELPDSGLYSQKWLSVKRSLVASPDYLKSSAEIVEPADLTGHQGLIFNAHQHFDKWVLSKNERATEVQLHKRILCNSYQSILTMAEAGVGIACLFDYLTDKPVNEGKLETVLPCYELGRQNLFALYTQPRKYSAKLDAFLDYLLSSVNSNSN